MCDREVGVGVCDRAVVGDGVCDRAEGVAGVDGREETCIEVDLECTELYLDATEGEEYTTGGGGDVARSFSELGGGAPKVVATTLSRVSSVLSD